MSMPAFSCFSTISATAVAIRAARRCALDRSGSPLPWRTWRALGRRGAADSRYGSSESARCCVSSEAPSPVALESGRDAETGQRQCGGIVLPWRRRNRRSDAVLADTDGSGAARRRRLRSHLHADNPRSAMASAFRRLAGRQDGRARAQGAPAAAIAVDRLPIQCRRGGLASRSASATTSSAARR